MIPTRSFSLLTILLRRTLLTHWGREWGERQRVNVLLKWIIWLNECKHGERGWIENEVTHSVRTFHKPWSMKYDGVPMQLTVHGEACECEVVARMWSRSTNVRLYSILSTDMPLYDHTKIAVCVNCWGNFKWLPTFPWSRLTSFPGPAQLFIACHTASNEKLGGTWERG